MLNRCWSLVGTLSQPRAMGELRDIVKHAPATTNETRPEGGASSSLKW
jgi:hypothetical protein